MCVPLSELVSTTLVGVVPQPVLRLSMNCRNGQESPFTLETIAVKKPTPVAPALAPFPFYSGVHRHRTDADRRRQHRRQHGRRGGPGGGPVLVHRGVCSDRGADHHFTWPVTGTTRTTRSVQARDFAVPPFTLQLYCAPKGNTLPPLLYCQGYKLNAESPNGMIMSGRCAALQATERRVKVVQQRRVFT